MHNELVRDRFKFSVKMEKGFEKDIAVRVEMTNNNKVRLLLSYDKDPLFTDHDFM